VSVVLIGLPASGKTTIGEALAARLGVDFADTDQVVEARTGRLVREIFAESGEAAFRALEEAAARDVLGRAGVVSLGGGAIMNPAIRELVCGHSVVWLDVSVTTLTRRAGMTGLRPLLLGDVRERLTALAGERTPVYAAAAGCRVDAEQPVDAVVGAILDYLGGVRVIPVAGERPYNVRIGRGIADRIAESLAGVTTTAIIHPPVLAPAAARLRDAVPGATLIEVADGEPAKTVDQLGTVWRALAGAGLTRSDAVVGLGGGTTTDLAGFAAATYLRGIRFVNVPTTVLAMADAAVGGKTGINLPEGKNLAGAFWEPAATWCDLALLDGLPADQVRSGVAEIVKAGFIADPAILDIEPGALLDTGGAGFADALGRAIAVKAGVVAADLREEAVGSVGRAALNYGHTLGHAIEQVEGYTWAHGYAVSVGMVYAAEVAARLGLIGPDLVDRHRTLLGALGLPVTYAGAPWDEVRSAMARDKKARGTTLRLVLLDGVGSVRVVPGVDEAVLRASYDAIGG